MKKLILLLALCFTTHYLFAQATDSIQIKNQLRNEGNEALNAKNYALAFQKYSDYLKQTNNQDSIVAFNCGVCADNVKKYNESAYYFNIAIQKGYNLANAYVGKASAFQSLKKNNEYMSPLEKVHFSTFTPSQKYS